MAKIELSQLIAEMTPEQKIFMQHFYATFDSGNAANRRIINVEPLFFGAGNPGGTEFETYAANKLYLCLNMVFPVCASQASVNALLVYNEANALIYSLANVTPYYNGASYLYYMQGFSISNLYFSRIALGASAYTRMLFYGYRVTLQ